MPRRSKTWVLLYKPFHTALLSSGRIVPRVTIAEVNHIHPTLQFNKTLNGAFLSNVDVKLNDFIGEFHSCFGLDRQQSPPAID